MKFDPNAKPLPYLTKEDPNEHFLQNCQSGLKDIEKKRALYLSEIEKEKGNIKLLEEKERLNVGEIKKLLPIYQKQRDARDKIKALTDSLKKLGPKEERMKHLEMSLKRKDDMFASLNIDLSRKRPKSKTNEVTEYYLEKKIDQQKLKRVRKGFYLDILENTASQTKLSYGKREVKYDLKKILQNENYHALEVKGKLKGARVKQEKRQELMRQKHASMKLMRNEGNFFHQNLRGSLYPEELCDDFNEEYNGLAAIRGLSGYKGNILLIRCLKWY